MYSIKFEKRVTQAATYFLTKEGGQMFFIKLLKLLYLADRKALEVIGVPISFDDYYSFDNGPVLSKTYDFIKLTSIPPEGDYWKRYISTPVKNKVELIEPVEPVSLSDAEIMILDQIYTDFGSFDPWKLVDYTHSLPEYRKPSKGSRLPINRMDILKFVLKNEDEAEIIEEQIQLHEFLQT